MRTLSVLLFLVFLLGGCSTPGTLDVGFHGSDSGYAQALLAAYTWNAACGATLVEVHRGDGEVQLYEQSGLVSGQALGDTHLERPVLGFLGHKEPTEIHFTSDSHYALPVIAHEFGHSLGLDHEDGGIMTPGNELPSMRVQLDPATAYRTLAPGLITPELCQKVFAR